MCWKTHSHSHTQNARYYTYYTPQITLTLYLSYRLESSRCVSRCYPCRNRPPVRRPVHQRKKQANAIRRRHGRGRVQVHTQSWEVLKIISSLEAHSSGRLHQRSGVRESRGARRRGLLTKFGGRGGRVRRRAGMQSRGARGVRGVGGLTCHWPRARGQMSFRSWWPMGPAEGRPARPWTDLDACPSGRLSLAILTLNVPPVPERLVRLPIGLLEGSTHAQRACALPAKVQWNPFITA